MLLLLWKNIAVISLIGLSEKPEPALNPTNGCSNRFIGIANTD
jgi:hypothetical protein